MLNRPVLVLNASYEGVSVISARRAMTMVCKGVACVQEVSPYKVRTDKMVLPVPSVIRLNYYRKVPRPSRSLTRKQVLLRDGYVCQYCGKKFPVGELTLDHVMPQSRGGGDTWENLVTACFPCNNKKRACTPEEAGMKLLRRPVRLLIHAKHRLLMSAADQNAWGKYLYA